MPKYSSALRILLTGADGFVGSSMLRQLSLSDFKDAQFFSWVYSRVNESCDHRLVVDIRQRSAVFNAIKTLQPTHVIHLAAQSSVPVSFTDPQLTWDVNVMGTLNLFDAIKKYVPQVEVLHVSTSEIYGKSFQQGEPVSESAILQPQNPYAASKAASDLMAGQYASQGMKIVRMRPFNHIGPGQSEAFVVSSFAAQVARIECGQQPPVIRVGNLNAYRDFLSVDDVVQAYLMALQQISDLPAGLVLNICSGVPRKIADILTSLISYASCPIDIEIDQSRIRPNDTPIAVGVNDSAKHYLGWQPQINFQTTLLQILNAWRKKMGGIER